MNVKRALLVTAMGVFSLAGAEALEAQAHLGGHFSYGLEEFSEPGIGVDGTYLFTDVLAGAASFTYHFPGDDITFWDLNFNAQYHFPMGAAITPYLGGGINYSRLGFDVGVASGSTSEVGLNLLGGGFMDFDNAMRLFGEGRFVLSDADQLVLSLGLGVPVGN